MSSRHLARSLAMQTLYEWDFRELANEQVGQALERNIEEFGPGLSDKKFATKIVEQVLEKHSDLDELIRKAAPEWPLHQIAVVDRNVLRVGLWELLYGDYKQVPPKVAINEAIELAKTFGGPKSGKFVNGVLGTIYREMGEPGKDESGNKQEYTAEDLDKLPIEGKVGGVVYRKTDKGLSFALVHDVFGYWTLSKGSLKEDESPEEGAERKAREELGLKHVQTEQRLGENEYIAHDPEKGPVRRQVTYFLVSTTDTQLEVGKTGGLDGADWFSAAQLAKVKTYPDIKMMFERALEILQKA